MHFVRLAQKRQSEIAAQLEALRHQHERGRELVTGIANAIEGYAADDPNATATLLENIGAYTSLLRHRIHTEDHVFFPMARDEMTEEEFKALTIEFDKEGERHGAQTFEQNQKIVVDLKAMLEEHP